MTTYPGQEAIYSTLQQQPNSQALAPAAPAPSSSFATALSAPLSAAYSVKQRFDGWRERLGYSSPGSYESFGREIKMLQTSAFTFDGAKAELSKSISLNPAFQVSHAFTLGNIIPQAGVPNPGTYNFAGIYGSDHLLMQGSVENDGSVSGRCNLAWNDSKNSITKMQAQLAPNPASPSMFIFEHDYTGLDYALNFKAINPSLTDGQGTYALGGLIAITPRIAIGVENIIQKQYGMDGSATGFKAKYTPANRDWLATAELTGQKTLSLQYWQKLAERVEGGAELVMAPSMVPTERKAVATVGAKYEYRMSTFRGQMDSMGKVSAFLEQRLNPMMAFLLSGEIDHVKNSSKFGVGIMIESSLLDESKIDMATFVPARPPM